MRTVGISYHITGHWMDHSTGTNIPQSGEKNGPRFSSLCWKVHTKSAKSPGKVTKVGRYHRVRVTVTLRTQRHTQTSLTTDKPKTEEDFQVLFLIILFNCVGTESRQRGEISSTRLSLSVCHIF